ncbi:MAG: ABC transporter substrate-binding protein, partial [Lachnospiraceae bacterium]|nr:ABC transporter substrate-binding protein [Lachnospiraceae bacterium]
MKRKAITWMISLAMAAAVLTGCGAGETSQSPNQTTEEGSEETEAAKIRVGSLKGPTSIGLVYLMDRASKQETADHYDFTMAATADELLPSVISGDLDILLIPANVSGVLYMRTEGNISVIDINT